MSYSQKILLSYLAFGVLMGIAFPFYVVFFVEVKPDMAIYFKLSTNLSDTMSSNSGEIAASIDEMTAIARKSAGNAQQVTASSEEQLVSMKEISQSSERLSQMAEELRQYVGRFNL